MDEKTLLVIGAAGDVGRGIVSAALQLQWSVVAAGRNAEKLDRLRSLYNSTKLETVVGDIGSEEGASQLWTAASAYKQIDAVVVTVNAPNSLNPLLEWDTADLSGIFDTNVLTHFIALKTFLPRLPNTGLIIGIGGGTADFVIPKMGHLSMLQAALRMMYRAVGREQKSGASARELMIISMVNGESKRATADPTWITDIEVGHHVCAIIDRPAAFPGPILTLKSKDQVGRPDTVAA